MKAEHLTSPRRKTSSTASSHSSLSPTYRSPLNLEANSLVSIRMEPKITAITASRAVIEYYNDLTEYERDEIVLYEEIYFLGQGCNKCSGKYTENHGDYIGLIGDHIAYKYEIIKLLGKGAFGQVFECIDRKEQEHVAIKIIKNKVRFRRAGDAENELLDVLMTKEDGDFIVKKLDSFEFRGHLCIVFELLSISLYQFLEKNHFQGLGINLVKRIAVQLLITLKTIHAADIIHCDLKPENILLKYENKSSIKLIDFGSACGITSKVFDYVQSRFYRAPEVILGYGYDEKIDI